MPCAATYSHTTYLPLSMLPHYIKRSGSAKLNNNVFSSNILPASNLMNYFLLHNAIAIWILHGTSNLMQVSLLFPFNNRMCFVRFNYIIGNLNYRKWEIFSTCWFTSSMITMVMYGPGWNQEPRAASRSPYVGSRDPSIWAIFYCFCLATLTERDGAHSSQDVNRSP